MLMAAHKDFLLCRRLLQEARPYWLHLAAILLPAAAAGSATAVLVLAAVLLVVTTLLLYLQALGNWLLQTYTGEKMVLAFRAKLFRHVQRLSLGYHDTKGTTD